MKANSFKENFASLNKHIKRHNILMIIASSIVTAVAILFVLYWEYDYNDISFAIDTIYLIGNLFFFVISLALTVLLVLSRFIKFKTNALAYAYAKYEKGLEYKDVFQIADQIMHKNKAALKEKYGLAKR